MDNSQTRLGAHEVLFHEGDSGHAAYLIESGRVAVLRHHEGEDQILGVISAGECIGEMALISNEPRLATAMALEDSVLTVITRQHLDERMARSDPLVRHLLQLTLKRYRQALGKHGDDHELPSLAGLGSAGIENTDEQMAMQRMRTEHALKSALDTRDFVLFFQPIVRLADRKTAGFEALLRWRRADGELIAPDLFIPVAEESHIIEAIGQWIIDEACRCRALLKQQYAGELDENFSISVNLAARQFPDPQLLPCIEQALQRHGMQPNQLRMEVTESQILENWQQALDVLHAIKKLGCKIAIDDFGTGNSSLAYLNRLPVDTLKIDKAFLQDMLNDPAAQKIIAGMARLSADLGLSFIAEGAETQQQVDVLAELGVEHVQGYFFGRPFGLQA